MIEPGELLYSPLWNTIKPDFLAMYGIALHLSAAEISPFPDSTDSSISRRAYNRPADALYQDLLVQSLANWVHMFSSCLKIRGAI